MNMHVNLKHNEMLKRMFVGVVVLILFCVAAISYRDRSVVYTLLDHYNLVPKEEHYTELYFEDPTHLPSKVATGDKVSFSFTVHSMEGKNTERLYIVYFASDDGYNDMIDNGMLSLGDGEYKTLSESYTFARKVNAGRVVVELPTLNQKIDFLTY